METSRKRVVRCPSQKKRKCFIGRRKKKKRHGALAGKIYILGQTVMVH